MTTARDASRDIVITGMGIFSPIGVGIDAFWNSLAEGRSGIHRVKIFPGFAAPDQAGGVVTEFTEESAKKVYLKDHRKNLKAMCREIQLGVASATQALQNSALNLEAIDHERLGVEFGANLMLSAPDILQPAVAACAEHEGQRFEYGEWAPLGIPKMEPLWLLRYLPNMPACHISIGSDARGPSNSLTLDDASGNTVLSEACRILDRGTADVMITGVTGTTMHPIKTMHLALFHDLASTPAEPERRCRPFDLHRAGRVVSEGTCTLILESRGHAEARGAKIWARIAGTGMATVTDATGKPDFRRALAGAMNAALRSAGMSPGEIGHVNAHGVGTKDGDIAESQAIHDVFGPERGRTIPVTALKSFLGNSGAGSGLLELAGSILGLSRGVIPFTINYETPDPACPVNVVTKEPLSTTNKFVMNVNVTRIGQASAAIVEVA
ncbi:MAG: beta-ketoacyl-[acyl-carrier-protein] synthase family protein [Planctomycetaceae bacterium]